MRETNIVLNREIIFQHYPCHSTARVYTTKHSFITLVLENVNEMKPGNDIAANDYGVKLPTMLRGSKPLVSEFLVLFRCGGFSPLHNS